MDQIEYRGVKFDVRNDYRCPICFILGVRKSGSSILNKMVNALALIHNFGFVDFGRMFEAGLMPNDWREDPGLEDILFGGTVYGGFRDFPTGLKNAPGFISGQKVLLVRDPRDALVSEYFSTAYSHPVPAEGPAREDMLAMREKVHNSSLEEAVLRRPRGMRITLMEYAPLLSDPKTKVYRYEDVIFDKRRLLEEISVHFGWPVEPKGIDLILKWADVVPKEERPTEFIRQVRPGDHKRKLSDKAIAELDRILAEPLKLFGYAS